MRGWFGPKLTGFGVSPCSWQGWVATGLFMAALVGGNSLLRHWGLPQLDLMAYNAGVLLAFLAVVSLTYQRDR